MTMPEFIPFATKAISPFAPQLAFLIGEASTNIDCLRLKEYLLSKEEYVLSLDADNDGSTGLGLDSTTARYRRYNVMEWDSPDIHMLRTEIDNLYNEYYHAHYNNEEINSNGLTISCWMNIMRKGDRIQKHLHGYSPQCFLSGHFCVCTDNTRTVYVNPYEHQSEDILLKEVEDIPEGEKSKMIVHQSHGTPKMYAALNKSGNLTLFPNYVPHFTTTYMGDDVRITLAFELRPRFDNYVPL
tara:strand:- start:254 stop:976 length:723 start_codon:yes stop_codon:yes gene_type:complete